ncbi:MAG: hypothetical protein ACODAU_07310 [Myxococcota bacterium]
MGLLILAGLSLLAGLAAVAVVERYGPSGLGEHLLATLLFWLALILLPIHVLGWVDLLTPVTLAIGSGITSASVLALALGWGGGVGARWRRVRASVRRLVAVPWLALRAAWQERSLVAGGLLLAYGILAWTAWLTWLAPSGSWDGLTYHEPIVYYALQSNGFRLVEAAPSPIGQQINSAPRVGHYVSLWLVAFADRRLVELTPTLMAVPLLVGFFVIARRYTERVAAMGWAVALFLVPGILLQLRSTMQDASFAAIFTVALAFVLRPELRARDALVAALALGLAGGFKATGLLLVPLYALLVVGRVVLRARRGNRLRWLGTVLGGAAVIALWMAPTYVRNWVEFDNPVWPRKFEYPAIGVRFDGFFDPYHRMPADKAIENLFAPPLEGRQYHDTRDNGYGNGPPFVVLPLALLALVLLPLRLVGALLARAPPPAGGALLLAATLPALLAFRLSPSHDWARYNVYAIVVAFALAAWVVGRPSLARLRDALIGALLVTGAMTLWWSEPAWGIDWDQARQLARLPVEERAVRRFPGNFNMQESLARRREREIGGGDLVAYSHGTYVGVLWNEQLSNRVRFVGWPGSAEAYLERLDALGAEWVQVGRASRAARALNESPRWERLGATRHPKRPPVVFGRRRSREGGSPAPR